jgi:hypothetical protein
VHSLADAVGQNTTGVSVIPAIWHKSQVAANGPRVRRSVLIPII